MQLAFAARAVCGISSHQCDSDWRYLCSRSCAVAFNISATSPLAPEVSAAAPRTSPAPELTKADLETFLDALIPSQLRNRNIAGAVVSVVKDSQVLFQKGYGYADVEQKKPRFPIRRCFAQVRSRSYSLPQP